MSGVAQLSWGDGGVGSRLCLSQLALSCNDETELSKDVVYFLRSETRARERVSHALTGSKRDTPKKGRVY